MSTIVVVQKSGVIVIAADSLTKAGSIKLKREFQADGKGKIFKHGDTYLGTVGALVHMDVLQSIFRKYPEKICLDSREDIFETYTRIHPILKDEYFINPAADKDDEYESSQIDGLLANSNGIFGMYSWRTVVQYSRFYAVGSGREFALGAMQATYEQCSAREIAEAGIRSAAAFDDGTDLPIEIYEVASKRKAAAGNR